MANREDNMKKINAELEKLSDEQLDQVAGGYFNECSQMVGAIEDASGKDLGFAGYDGNAIEWLNKNLGIEATFSRGFLGIGSDPNTYKKDGSFLTHGTVLKMVEDWGKLKKQGKVEDKWNSNRRGWHPYKP